MKGSLNESLDLYKRSLEILENLDDKVKSKEALSIIYNNMGSVFIAKGEYDKSLYISVKILK